MNYKEALDFAESGLYGHFEQEEYMKRILILFDNPQKNLKIIHIAGTNGKGTTGFYLARLLEAQGYKTGHFSSPHISDYRERIMIGNEWINKDDFIKACEEVKSKEDLIKESGRWPTYFEMSLLIALITCRDQVEYLILETGIGGREDATNQVGNTVLSIITTIGFDHTQMLGETLEEIAFHKAGIIKERTAAVSFVHNKEVDKVLQKEADLKNSPLYFVNPQHNMDFQNGHAVLQYHNKEIRLKSMGLQQGYNANLAIKAYEILLGGLPEDFTVLEEAVFPGRMEVISTSPLFIIDGAHNEEGIALLSENLKHIPYDNLILILGTMGDKEINNFSDIVDLSSTLILTRLEYERAQSPEKILKNHQRASDTYYEESLEKGVDIALDKGGKNDLVLCTGSLYLIGAVRDYKKRLKGE